MNNKCPYCDKDVDSNEEVITCSNQECKRLLKRCTNHSCRALNKMVARYCHQCGVSLINKVSNESDWSQDGKDAFRSSFNPKANSGNYNNLDLKARYPEKIDKFNLNLFNEKLDLPGLIIVNDLLVYYDPVAKSFVALFYREQEIYQEKSIVKKYRLLKKWECPFDDYEVSKVSSPVAYNGFLYVLSANPQLLHKISLDNGARTILTVKATEAQKGTTDEYFELFGTSFKDCSPLLIENINNQTSAPYLFIINKDNTWAIDLSEEAFDSDSLSLNAWLYKYNKQIDNEISRPVFVGDFLISTLLKSKVSGFVYFDLNVFPIKFEPKVIESRKYEISKDKKYELITKLDKCEFTPCVASKSRIVSWFAFEKSCEAFYSVKFRSLNDIEVKKHQIAFDSEMFDKVSYLVPINAGGTSYTSIKLNGDNQLFKVSTNKSIANINYDYLFEFAIPIDDTSIIIPFGVNNISIVNTISEEPPSNYKTLNDDSETIINRPVKKDDLVFYQTVYGIVCFSLTA